MKKALISPIEIITHDDGVQTAYRVAQVSDESFDVAAPFFWVDCSDDIEQDIFVYVNSEIISKETWNPQPTTELNLTYNDGSFNDSAHIIL